MVKALRHVGLVVNNLEEMSQFYQDQLGFSVLKDAWEPSPFADEILNLESVKLRTVKMQAASGSLLELLYFASHPSASGKGDIHRPGFTHIALTVEDLDSLVQRMKKSQVRFLSSPRVSPDGKAKVVFCQDPEGNFLELVEELHH